MTHSTVVSIPDKVEHHPRILAGWIDHEQITVRGAKTDVYAARCERCGKEVSRTADRTHARADLLRHRAGCRPKVEAPGRT